MAMRRLVAGSVAMPVPARRAVGVPLVPRSLVPLLHGPTAQAHCAFLARKWILGQDSLLLSEQPDGFARLLALGFAEMANREVEFVTLTPETREHDLKQARDFVGGATVWRDEAVVRAALAGRLLVLDGLHTVEANVLPLLNSLLEAREMQLEDGRLVVSAQRYAELLARNSDAQLTRNGIVSCHADFRVICLSLPVPPFAGSPLDPPLRSRLQARFIRSLAAGEVAAALQEQYAEPIVKRAMSATQSLLVASSAAAAETRPKIPDVRPALLSLPFELAAHWQRHPQDDNTADLVSRYLGPGEDLAKLFKSKAIERTDLVQNLIQDLEHNVAVSIAGPRGTGRRHAALEVAQKLRKHVEIASVFPNMLTGDLFASRSGSTEQTVWNDSPLVRAMKSGSVCIVEGLENAPSLVAVLNNVLEQSFMRLPSGEMLVTRAHWEEMQREAEGEEWAKQGVIVRSDAFRVIVIQDAKRDRTEAVGPVHNVQQPTFRAMEELLNDAVPQQTELAKRVAQFSVAAGLAGKKFSTANAITTLRLAQVGGIDAASVIRDCMLYRFLSQTARQELDAVLKDTKLEGFVQPVNTVAMDQASGKVDVTEDHHLIPSSTKFVANVTADKILLKIDTYIRLGLPILLLGVQGVGKNVVVDKALNRPRQYIQLHLDSTVQSLFSTTVIEQGRLTMQDSPLLVAIRKGQVCVLDEVDKAAPQVVASLRGLLSGLIRLPDGRCVVREQLRHLVPEGNEVIAVHPDFRLIMLANPGVAPFLGSNVLDSLGSLCNALVMDPPSVDSMIAILTGYNQSSPAETIEKLSRAFAELFRLNLDGELSYAFGLREAISVVKDLNVNGDLISSLSNVFDHEVDLHSRRKILQVLSSNGLKIDLETFTAGPGMHMENVRLQISGAVPRESEQSPKHGKASDGKQHVGGNTWEGGTGGSSTAGLGGRHGPYRLDLGKFDVHQVADEDKVWTDPEAEKRARQMAKEALEKRLKEIDMGSGEFAAYSKYASRVQREVELVRGMVAQLSSNKSSTWARLLEGGGVLDESRLVDALAGDRRFFKRLTKAKQTLTKGTGKVYLRFCFDCSGSIYRFNSLDQRLERELECLILLMEGFENAGDRVSISITGHSGEEKKVQLLGEDNQFPRNTKERYAVLERLVAHSQFCWSGDSTLLALQTAVADLEQMGTENDSRHVFIISDANFRRYNISPARFSKALTQSSKVECAAIFIGQLGSEAEELQQELPPGKAFVALKSADLPGILFTRLVSAVQKTHL